MCGLDLLKLGDDLALSPRIAVRMICESYISESANGSGRQKESFLPSFLNCFLISAISAPGCRPRSP